MSSPTVSYGHFRAKIISEQTGRPIENVTVQVFNPNENEKLIEEVKTDINGKTPIITLNTPSPKYSMEPSENKPYSEYNLLIRASEHESVEINNMQVFPGVTAIQEIALAPKRKENHVKKYVIPSHTLFGDYQPKIAETEIKPSGNDSKTLISRIVIPENIIVHDGPPTDNLAIDYCVKYRDYIKNVSSGICYPTWPKATLEANILVIISFTLNRVYTEWYRNKGYPFTITSSTIYDQKWVPGRVIYDRISDIVDTIFSNYLSRPNVAQPIFTQYCDGKKISYPNWMSQWGSKSLGERGLSALEILRDYYGDSIYINIAREISGVPYSWSGNILNQDSGVEKIRQLQFQLNAIADAYSHIPHVAVDGIYGAKTKDAVRIFQRIFDLPQTGIVDFRTWHKISAVYSAMGRIP